LKKLRKARTVRFALFYLAIALIFGGLVQYSVTGAPPYAVTWLVNVYYDRMPFLVELFVPDDERAEVTPLSRSDRLVYEAVARELEVHSRPLRFYDFKRVSKLNIPECGLTDVTLLALCTEIRELALYYNPVEDVSPLSACIKLRTLNLTDCLVRDIYPVCALPELEELTLQGCPLSEGLDALDELTPRLMAADFTVPELREAVALADDMIASLPAYAREDPRSAAAILFRRVVEGANYGGGAESADQSASAALRGDQTLCWGIARALTLVYNRAGIRAATVTGYLSSSNGGNSEGHAWVLMELGGALYYADPTAERERSAQTGNVDLAYFMMDAESMTDIYTWRRTEWETGLRGE